MSSPPMQSAAAGESEAVRERLAGAAQTIVARLVADPGRQAKHLGQIFLACEQAAREHPEAFRQALRANALDAFLMPCVRASLQPERAQSFSGGWLGTYVGADGRAIEAEEGAADATDSEALEISSQALHRAMSIAKADGNKTLLRNLRWYRERLAHKSYEAIARAEGKVSATVRTGAARARKFLLRIVHELQHAQPAPLNGEAPRELEPLRRMWYEQDLESLARELERTRLAYEHDPHWLNLAALLAADRGRHTEAARLYEKALVFADAPSVRGRVLNNLGNLFEEQGRLADAQQAWLRTNLLVPFAPAPLLNLLAAASLHRDYASAQHYIAELSNLFNSGRLGADERAYVCRRLKEKPELTWLRNTDVWRQGPARWIRAARRVSQAAVRGLAATAVLAALLLLHPGLARGDVGLLARQSPTLIRSRSAPPAGWATPRESRGGDSMGKPRKRVWAPVRGSGSHHLAGDSMGRSGGSRPGLGHPRPHRHH